MTAPKLSVVVPTRNRPSSVLRLLESINGQTMPAADFEVVVIDDGSQPPLELSQLSARVNFPIRLFRRDSDHGAHNSRFHGLRQSKGARVLFLDDDVTLEPMVLAAHAAVGEEFAVGPILYHPDTKTSAYQRWQSRRYMEYAELMAAKDDLLASDLYICNSSGPRAAMETIFIGIHAQVGGETVPGDGFDEELICYQLRDSAIGLRFVPDALILHVDTKTLSEARLEKRHRGQTQCRFYMTYPGMWPTLATFEASFLKPKVKLFWRMPRLFNLLSDVVSSVIERLPPRLLPDWVCTPPLSIAYWDGVRSQVPVYEDLRTALRTFSKTDR